MLLAALVPLLARDVTVADETFGGRPAVTLRNGTVEVTIVPSLGRVMRYGFVGKANVLYAPSEPAKIGRWTNYGGDRLWFATANGGAQPLEEAIDGGAFSLEKLKDGVRITSAVGKFKPVQAVREITLAAFGTRVTFRNRIVNRGDAPMELACWQATQVDDPKRIELPTARTSAQPNGYLVLEGRRLDPKVHLAEQGRLVLRRDPAVTYRFGSKAPSGMVSALTLNGTLVMTSRVYPRAKYPESESALGVLTSRDPGKYAELHAINPLQRLEPRQGDVQTVTWDLR